MGGAEKRSLSLHRVCWDMLESSKKVELFEAHIIYILGNKISFKILCSNFHTSYIRHLPAGQVFTKPQGLPSLFLNLAKGGSVVSTLNISHIYDQLFTVTLRKSPSSPFRPLIRFSKVSLSLTPFAQIYHRLVWPSFLVILYFPLRERKECFPTFTGLHEAKTWQGKVSSQADRFLFISTMRVLTITKIIRKNAVD